MKLISSDDEREAHHVANCLVEEHQHYENDERRPLLQGGPDERPSRIEQRNQRRDAEAAVHRAAWSKQTLFVAYSSLFLMACCVSLESMTVISLSTYATSSFKKHSMISTIFAIQGVISAVAKAPMAKFANVFGRLETYIVVLIMYILGYILIAASPNVEVYAFGQIFYAAGTTSLQISQQVFIADTTSLLNRAIFTRLPDLPNLVTVFVGPAVAELILDKASWRWGYGIWAILLPLTSLPLLAALGLHKIRVKKSGFKHHEDDAASERDILATVRHYTSEMDVLGTFLLTLGLGLTLVPISLANSTQKEFENMNALTPIIFGSIFLVMFVYYEARIATSPLVPHHLFRIRTVVAGCVLAFWYFMAFYFSVQPYLFSYLQVVHSMPVSTAGRITQTFGFVATISASTVSILIRHTRRYKRYVLLGCTTYVLALVSMLLYRSQSASSTSILLSQIALGAGGGIVNVAVQLGIQASLPQQSQADIASATAMFLTALELGGAVGSSVSGAAWMRMLPSNLRVNLPEGHKDEAQAIFEGIDKALSYPVGSEIRNAINLSYQQSMDVLLYCAIGVALLIIPLGATMRSIKL